MNLTSLNPYWLYIKLGACVLVIGAAYGFGYHTANLAGKFALASQLNAQADAYRKTVEQWQERAYKADEALRVAQQAIPATGTQVADEIRKHPTDPRCVVPDAIAERLHAGIAAGAANTAK